MGDEVIADHPRFFGRDRTIYDPWHYLPVLVNKPGALRNGAPFQDWDLPAALVRLSISNSIAASGRRRARRLRGTAARSGAVAVPGASITAGTKNGTDADADTTPAAASAARRASRRQVNSCDGANAFRRAMALTL